MVVVDIFIQQNNIANIPIFIRLNKIQHLHGIAYFDEYVVHSQRQWNIQYPYQC